MIRRIENPKLNWSVGMTAKDQDYIFSTITILAVNDILYIRLKPCKGKCVYVAIEDYKGYTASYLTSHIEYGRHFNSLIHTFYKQRGLPLGYTERIVRDVQSYLAKSE